MTLLGSFILTSKYSFVGEIKSRIFFLGGVYFGFSCFDCCGRWNSRKYALSTAVLPEVSNHFLPHTTRYKLLKELFSIVRNQKKQNFAIYYFWEGWVFLIVP
jgi:hypothetical protein